MLDNLQEYFETPIEIVFSKKRKTISIQIKPDSIRVLSTYWISKNSVREFILKNESWIRKKLADQKLRVKPITNLVNNEKLTLCGKNYTLKVNSQPIIEPEIRSETIIISNNFKTRKTFGSIESQILKLLKDFSFRVLQRKTFEISQIMNVRYNSVKIKNYKSRWGSCSSKGDISFNWKIIFAPENIIEYLVVHELSHLIYFNHSKLFWNKVEEFQYNYKENRKWLKENGYKLDL